MPPITDEEVEKQRERNEKLREQIAAANDQRLEREAEVANSVTMAALKAEEARLEAELAEAKELAKMTSVKAGVSAQIDNVKGTPTPAAGDNPKDAKE